MDVEAGWELWDMPLYLQKIARRMKVSEQVGLRTPRYCIEKERGIGEGYRSVQIFHQNIENFRPALGFVNSAEHWRHVRLFD